MRIFGEWRYVTSLLNLARRQNKIISRLRAENIELRRDCLDLACAWRISIERPEVDIRDDLSAMIDKLKDELSVLEEHSV